MHIFSSAWILGGDCALCAGSARALVCEACEAALPRVAAACRRCALPLPVAGLCGACLVHPPAFDRAVARFEYRFPVDRVVRRFKFHGDLALGRWLAAGLATAVGAEPRPDLIVAPPLSTERLRERGFNQALELARVVGACAGIAVSVDAVARARTTSPQPGLGREERRRNLRGAFRCEREVAGRRIAIVDDVLTTGATADELAATLKRAGAAHVSAWVVARTPHPGDP